MAVKTKILIVDDDVNFAVTLAKVLTVKGYEVTTADSGFRAVELVKERPFDIVIMDVKMPVMNGVEAHKKMKAMRPGMTVILMTAFSMEDLIKEAMREGAYAVLQKPFDITTIVNMIEMSRKGIFIAIVDDDPNVCSTMKNIFERKGYSVSSCMTGNEAISLARERRYDIFFIDMKLPVLNGLEVYQEIKKINPKAVVVAITAYREEVNDLVKEVMEKGAYACLYKPLDMDKVIKVIETVSEKIS